MEDESATKEFTIVFDYGTHDRLVDVATAMQSFCEAFESYGKGKDASLRIVRFEPGSLQCHMAANAVGLTSLGVMIQDLDEIASGRRSVFMPEPARKSLRRVLDHVNTVCIDIDSERHTVRSEHVDLLEIPPSEGAWRAISHAGVLDRIDLKANQFRIMLPHGHRLNCGPALPFIELLSQALHYQAPRVRVFGTGRYRRADILPSHVNVSSVEVIAERLPMARLVDVIAGRLSGNELITALTEAQSETERRLEEMRWT